MIKNRLVKYAALLFGSILAPVIVTAIIILVTGDRISGLKYFAIPSVLIVHLAFGYTQLKKSKVARLFIGAAAGLISCALASFPLLLGWTIGSDKYGYWDVVLFFAVGTIGSWKLIYHIDKTRVGKPFCSD